MRFSHLISLIVLLTLCNNLYGQRITYANDLRDSVQIDFGLIDTYSRTYKVSDVEVNLGGKIVGALDESNDGLVKIIIPSTYLENNHLDLVLHIKHKTDKSQNADIKISNRQVCVGFCCVQSLALKKPLIDKFEGGNTKTITSDEIEKGAY